MYCFSKKSQIEEYLNLLLPELKNLKIKAIFSLKAPIRLSRIEYYKYFIDSEIFILFENEKCLIIDYRFVDELQIEYRELTPEEKATYKTINEKDWFGTEACFLEYECIQSYYIKPMTAKYTKWSDNDIDFVKPTSETFETIKFIMDNGKSFEICADDAEADGYSLCWSEDAIKNTPKKLNN